MQLSSQPAQVAVPGFTDVHAHLLRQAAGADFPAAAAAVRAFHQRVAAAGSTMLTADPRSGPAADIDRIEVLGTEPVPF
ncbi:MAG: hypothetical protein ACLP7J_10050 [Streptosporangiaceae bacterium]|jgi:predicted amidohydrolase YtcJ